MSKWKTVQQNVVYENAFLKIFENDIIDPNGNPGKRNLIEVGPGSIVVIAEDEQHRIWIVGQERYATDVYSWELVSGGIKSGESGKKAATRELKEELGFDAGSIELISTFHPSNSLMNRSVEVFLAKQLTSVLDQAPDTYEDLSKKCLTAAEIANLIESGEIKDAYTICAMLSYWLKQKSIVF